MPEKRLYDTRFFVDYFYSKDVELSRLLKQEAKSNREKFVSALTIHEMHRTDMMREGKEVAAMRSHTIRTEFVVVDVDYLIAVKSAALRITRQMPMADSVIAATALIYGCTLFTDDPHFTGIPNLKTKWCA